MFVRLKEIRAVFRSAGKKMWLSERVMNWLRLGSEFWNSLKPYTLAPKPGPGTKSMASSIVYRAKRLSSLPKFWSTRIWP